MHPTRSRSTTADAHVRTPHDELRSTFAERIRPGGQPALSVALAISWPQQRLVETAELPGEEANEPADTGSDGC